MPDRSDEYRKSALECLELARTVVDPTVRTCLLVMAEKWFDLAGDTRGFNEDRMVQSERRSAPARGAGAGLAQSMTKRKGGVNASMNERDYPHVSELSLPSGSFRSQSDDMLAFHREGCIDSRRGRGGTTTITITSDIALQTRARRRVPGSVWRQTAQCSIGPKRAREEVMTVSVLQRLYDSEINFEVSSFWDGGFDVRLGDTLNGSLEQDKVKTWSQVEEWLRTAALKHYPDSAFAKQELRRISSG